MIKDNNCYPILFGKYKGRRFLVAPLVHFELVALKVVKRAMKHVGHYGTR